MQLKVGSEPTCHSKSPLPIYLQFTISITSTWEIGRGLLLWQRVLLVLHKFTMEDPLPLTWTDSGLGVFGAMARTVVVCVGALGVLVTMVTLG